jgi:hypothetical protein
MKEIRKWNPRAYNQLKAFTVNCTEDEITLRKCQSSENINNLMLEAKASLTMRKVTSYTKLQIDRKMKHIIKTVIANYQAIIHRECLDLECGKLQVLHLKKCIESLDYKFKAELSELVDMIGSKVFKGDTLSASKGSLQELVIALRFIQESKSLMKGLELLSFENDLVDSAKVIDLVESVSHMPIRAWMFGRPSFIHRQTGSIQSNLSYSQIR